MIRIGSTLLLATAVVASIAFFVRSPATAGSSPIVYDHVVHTRISIDESLPDDPSKPGFQPIDGRDRTDEPLRLGLPMPAEAYVFDFSNLVLVGAETAQFSVLERRPDGAIAWLGVDARLATKANKSSQSLLLTTGAANVVDRFLVTEIAGRFEIDVEGARFVVDRASGRLLESATVGEKPLFGAERAPFLGVRTADATARLVLSRDEWRLEDNGPLRATIRGAGTIEGREGRHEVRLTFQRRRFQVAVEVRLEVSGARRMVAKAPYDDLFLDLPGRAQGAVGAGVAETRESALPGGRRVRVDRKVAAAEVLTDLPMTHLPFAAIIAPPGELAAAVAVRTLGRRGPARSSTADDGALRTAVAALPDLLCSADQPSSLDFAEFLIAWAPDRQGIDSLLWSFEYPLAGRASDPTWYTLSGQVDCPVIAPIVDDVYRRQKKIALAPFQDGPVAAANEASPEAGTFRPSGSILSDAYDFLRLQGGGAAAYQRRAVAASRGVVRRGQVGMRLAPSQKIEDALSERAFLKECEGAALLARLTADPWIPLIDGETASAAASRAGRSPEAAAQALGIAVLAARFDPTKPNVERVQALILELDSFRVDRRRGALGQPDDPSSATFDLAPTALAAALRRVDLEPKVAETARDLIESCARYVRDERPGDERGDFALAEGFYATGDRQYLELAHLSIAATAKRGAVRAESPIGLDALLYVLQFNSSLTFWKELPIDAVRQADGRWRIAWTTPLGATGWRLKVADRRIVDSLVFEPRTGAYRHDPATHQPFFAAVSLTGLPNLGPTGTHGEAIVDVPIAGDAVHFQARFRQSDLRKAGGLDPHRGPVAPPQDATRAGSEAPTTAALPSPATTRPKGPLALESMPVEVQRKVRVARQLFWAKVAGAIGTFLIFAIVLTRKRRK